MGPSPLLLLFFFFFLTPARSIAGGATFGFDIHHRYSDSVRRWAGAAAGHFPEKGSLQYYATLAGQDQALRGRALSQAQDLTFSSGNATVRLRPLGYLYYTVVTVGTPNVTFLVALDTGSDLFWVPCDCLSCAPASSPSYEFVQEIKFNTYSPQLSSTSHGVPCNSSYCELKSKCSRSADGCPYSVRYATANTSSSGILVEDVLHLVTDDTNPRAVKARIVLGCGQSQTGSFLGSAAPNGLFGLGMDNLSVPSILSSTGLTSNSFSMCFGTDGLGTISFGDKGSFDQDETSFHINHVHPTYNISLTGMDIGNTSINVQFSALVDSGTSFTYMADPAYTLLVDNFNAQVQEKRWKTSDPTMPFKFCYHLSTNTTVRRPDLNLTTEGGGKFPVNHPIVLVDLGNGEYIYCLAVLKSHSITIIGENFMTGLRLVFDRERMILGWKNFNCSSMDSSKPLPANPPSPAFPPSNTVPTSHAPHLGPAKQSESNTQAAAPKPSLANSSTLNSFTRIISALFLLGLAIF